MGLDATITIPVAATSAAATAPSGLYVGADLDRTPYRPPVSSMRGWRIAQGPPVVLMPPAASVTAAGVLPTLTVSESAVILNELAMASALTLAPDVSINFVALPDIVEASAEALAAEARLAATAGIAAATAEGIAPANLYVGPNLYPISVTGVASASAATVAPSLSIGQVANPPVAGASAAGVNPTISVTAAYKGAASGTTSATMPTHAVGDLIVVWSIQGTAPAAGGTVPSFTTISGGSGQTIGYAVATATNHTTGTWTSSSQLIAVVLRAASIGGYNFAFTSGTTSSVTAPAITQVDTSGNAVLLHFLGTFGSSSGRTWSVAPTGYTSRLTVSPPLNNFGVRLITKNITTTDGAVTNSLSATTASQYSATLEVLG